ncbi:TetR/AcrR family transcriptional regulator [Algiphilus sp. W345]|uniref:TetR/AcrR family transcriptional regulator n=1 Tax=Banduia mediterranea TaxID=3075609 RepID=A0ABU2WGP2_9GAMM|nr:TetR/AcrR family transcriptional regulator [Algiphilus sp. W345]MDT0496434.1 TetR/AcrR family transcriptional regulator [Algiphilus sp. W345]
MIQTQSSKAAPSSNGRGRPSAREAMLDAAERVVLHASAARLTLDAVAQEAAVSKGGVMYHFPSKDALLRAMVERLVERSIAGSQAVADSAGNGPGRQMRAYVAASTGNPLGNDQVAASMLAAVANDPALLEPVREFFQARFPKLAQGLSLERAAVVHLATEGLWMMELMQLSPFSPTQRARLVNALLRLTDEGSVD